ncbi:MAG: hypothetical protein JWP87_2946 [Labilithrix sp.]|jgi:hypothetical protein|nr:hypothetical protein [Labilithrix sp.]
MPFRRSLRWIAVVTVTASLAAGIAAAAGPDDRAAAEAALREIDASPKKDVTAEMAARSRAALERASKLRASGDEPHARLADGLARTWAEAARDVLRAVDVEEKAQTARRAATDAGVVAERERALLEEGIAQSGRLRAQLESTEREAKEQPARTSAAANSDTGDGGAARPKAPPKAPPPPALAPPSLIRDGGAR